jgi:hypothetical protein
MMSGSNQQRRSILSPLRLKLDTPCRRFLCSRFALTTFLHGWRYLGGHTIVVVSFPCCLNGWLNLCLVSSKDICGLLPGIVYLHMQDGGVSRCAYLFLDSKKAHRTIITFFCQSLKKRKEKTGDMSYGKIGRCSITKPLASFAAYLRFRTFSTGNSITTLTFDVSASLA